MNLIKFVLSFAAFLMVFSAAAFAQNEAKDGMAGWEVVCVDGLKEGVVIPCPGFEVAGFNYAITRELSVNWDTGYAKVILNFTRLDDDRQRGLKIVEVTPARDEENERQEYWYSYNLGGPGGEEMKTYFLTFYFHCKNPNNADRGRGGHCADGTYNGQVKFRDSKSGPVHTLTLTVNVTSLKSEN